MNVIDPVPVRAGGLEMTGPDARLARPFVRERLLKMKKRSEIKSKGKT
jgi:hypothetical protein